MLELKGELVFKTVAYHRAADAIGRSPVDLVAAYRSGTPPQIPGVGKAISDKLAGAGHDRPPRLLRAAPGRDPADARRPARDPGGSARRPSASSTRSSASRPSTTCARPPRPAGCATLRGMSARTEALVLEGIAKLDDRFDRMRLDRAEELLTVAHRRAVGHARGRLDRAGRLVPPAQGIDRRPRPPRRDRPAGGADRRVHPLRAGRFGHQPGRLQGGRPAAARPAGRPDGHAAGRGRAPTGSTSPAPRSTTSGCGRWPATRAGACPRRASCGSARTASR